ncbi:uncharacterized protein V1510DRAFT_307741 [Dipodascopsis tothii]|uniref:uncharacterized protein n=1 Tax=Dipodascopsis tothii TaxID=44089 RepID=UPI0034CED941
MTGTSKELFGFLASKVSDFINDHLGEHFEEMKTRTGEDEHIFKLGFTFSFPINQTAVNRGTLLRWTKGFDVVDAIGKDVCLMLQEELDALDLKTHVAALVNDTVGTLMSRAYTFPGNHTTVAGVILGTGTNCAYIESMPAITKLDHSAQPDAIANVPNMIVNTEWGAFDDELLVMPMTIYDRELDGHTPNPGAQMFEKRVSGMFLGELLRCVVADLIDRNVLFGGRSSTPLITPWSQDTSVLSRMQADITPDLETVNNIVTREFEIPSCTYDERVALKTIVDAIGRRSAYLSGAVISGLLRHTKSIGGPRPVDIGVDGSVFEFYPDYEIMMREAIAIALGSEVEQAISIGIAKDGSGVGAALCALVA